MKNMLNVFIAILFTLQLSCKKEPIIPIEPVPDTNKGTEMHIVWGRYVWADSSFAFFNIPHSFGDYVVFCSKTGASQPYKPNIIAVYNKYTGEKHLAWDNEIDLGYSDIKDWDVGGSNHDIAVIRSHPSIRAYDLNTANLMWEITPSENLFCNWLSTFDNYTFCSIQPDNRDIWGKLLRIDIETGESTELLHLDMENDYEFQILPPEVYIAPLTGDTLLIFQKRQWNFAASDGKVDIYAYNMTADSIQWIVDDITEDGSSSTCRSIIANNRYLFQGANSIHCIDIELGVLLWEDEMLGESFFQQTNLYADGKVFLQSESGNIFCYDVANGNRLWSNTEVAANPVIGGTSRFDYYKGYIYLTSSESRDIASVPANARETLKCISMATGIVKWSSSIPLASYGVIIDQNTGYLYYNTAGYAGCIDLNKSPIYP